MFFRLTACILFFLCQFYNVYSLTDKPFLNWQSGISDFSKTAIVLIQEGFSNEYLNPDYNDEHWKRITVPSLWNEIGITNYTGIATYRLHIKLPEQPHLYDLGVNLGRIYDADETYFNGIKIGGYGKLDDVKSHAYDRGRIYEIPDKAVRWGKDNVLSIKVRGYFPEESGLVNGVYQFGKYEDLLRTYLMKDYTRIIMVVVYLVIGFYLFILYLQKRKGFNNAYFALFCLAFGVYFFLRTDVKYFFNNDFILLKKIEYLSLFMLFPSFLEFIRSYFEEKFNVLHILFHTSSSVCVALVLFSNNPLFWNQVNTGYYQYTWVLAILLIIFILLKWAERDKDARAFLLSFLILVTAVIVDTLYSRNLLTSKVINSIGLLTPYSFLLFIITIAVILANRHARIYIEFEQKSIHLERTLIERDLAYKQIDQAYLEAINRFAIMAELRDTDIGDHISRVALYVELLGYLMGLDHDYTQKVTYAAPMHDIGKVGIPDRILFKEGPLDADEWVIMKKHTTIGGKLFENASSNVLKMAREIAFYHHEKWDGSGYPEGLKGEAIPLSARLMAIADVYDALRSRRPYKPEMTHEKAIDIMENGDNRIKPGDFDPKILAVFLKYSEQFNKIFEENQGSDESPRRFNPNSILSITS